jgi:hypothetical protein
MLVSGKKTFFLSCICLTAVLLVGCRKDAPLDKPNQGSVLLSIKHVFGDSSLYLNQGSYTTLNAEPITITTFKYYISHIELIGPNGSSWKETESYHLIDQSVPSSLEINLPEIPTGKYNSIRFIVGIDSLRNVSGSQNGDLDPSLGMFWTWNSGYIFAKLEGYSFVSPAPSNLVIYHIGGYAGPDACQREVVLSFGNTPIQFNQNAESILRIEADAAKWFGPNVISISETPLVNDFGPQAAAIADNYSGMFSFIEVRN